LNRTHRDQLRSAATHRTEWDDGELLRCPAGRSVTETLGVLIADPVRMYHHERAGIRERIGVCLPRVPEGTIVEPLTRRGLALHLHYAPSDQHRPIWIRNVDDRKSDARVSLEVLKPDRIVLLVEHRTILAVHIDPDRNGVW